MKDGTIFSHLEEGILAGELVDVNGVVSVVAQREIAGALSKAGFGDLGGVVESLGGKYSSGRCRIMEAALRASRTALRA